MCKVDDGSDDWIVVSYERALVRRLFGLWVATLKIIGAYTRHWGNLFAS
jgi:hypothetical protein